ncbi:alpha/beta hydrolase [Carnobacterium gallinarum]|uniref:alpha/beta hydrolase n=1 Tax=Carnobacterium gallinarum TaxID=2749 RepID=UPI00054D0533|nr:alpha/beta hydrolase [Carnobacterium gallinarum]
MKTRYKVGISSLVVLIFIIIGGFYFLMQTTYLPSKAALTTLQTTDSIKVIQTKNVTVFEPISMPKPISVLFYQGALVDEASYGIWAKQLAEAGYSTYLIHQPLNLAVLGENRAETILADYPITNYVIGGHSLGGVMASRFAHNHLDDSLKGVFFLASYPDKKGTLATSKLPVLSLTGSNDGVLDWESYESSKAYLPTSTQFKTIEGGNHAGFGSYGDQKGDSKATISNQQQQQVISQDLISWLNQL